MYTFRLFWNKPLIVVVLLFPVTESLSEREIQPSLKNNSFPLLPESPPIASLIVTQQDLQMREDQLCGTSMPSMQSNLQMASSHAPSQCFATEEGICAYIHHAQSTT
jgi:hypothetical protein